MLAAIVLVAVKGLVKVADLRRLWQVSRLEFGVAMVALVGVLLLGILKGVLLAAIVSLLMLLRGAARPHVAALGRIPGTRRYSDVERNQDNETIPGALLLRVEASLLYFNAEHVRDTGEAEAARRRRTGTARGLRPLDLASRRRDGCADALGVAEGAGRGGHRDPVRGGARRCPRPAAEPATLGRESARWTGRISLDDVVREFESRLPGAAKDGAVSGSALVI